MAIFNHSNASLLRATVDGTDSHTYTSNYKQFVFSFTNIRGAISNDDSIQHFIVTKKPDILFLSETFLNSKISTPTYVGYVTTRSDRQHSKTGKRVHGGGIMLLVKNTLSYELLDISTTINFESMSILVKFPQRKFIFTCVYRPPGADDSLLDYIIDLHCNKRKKFPDAESIIAGDFNCHNSAWLAGEKTDEIGLATAQMAAQLGVSQLIHEPTHNSTDKK